MTKRLAPPPDAFRSTGDITSPGRELPTPTQLEELSDFCPVHHLTASARMKCQVFCSSQDLGNKTAALQTDLHPNNHSHLKRLVNETGPRSDCRESCVRFRIERLPVIHEETIVTGKKYVGSVHDSRFHERVFNHLRASVEIQAPELIEFADVISFLLLRRRSPR
jgi:hypothetical protein